MKEFSNLEAKEKDKFVKMIKLMSSKFQDFERDLNNQKTSPNQSINALEKIVVDEDGLIGKKASESNELKELPKVVNTDAFKLSISALHGLFKSGPSSPDLRE